MCLMTLKIALRALRRNKLRSFLTMLGIIIGVGSSDMIHRLMEWPIPIRPDIIAFALLVSGGVGVFFGFYPAQKASRLDPIEALRYE
jgi:putative ABC transport system permease protein